MTNFSPILERVNTGEPKLICACGSRFVVAEGTTDQITCPNSACEFSQDRYRLTAFSAICVEIEPQIARAATEPEVDAAVEPPAEPVTEEAQPAQSTQPAKKATKKAAKKRAKRKTSASS